MTSKQTPVKNRMRPIHPGEILQQEYLIPMGMSGSDLAKAIGKDANYITRIVAGKHAVTGSAALLLSGALGTSPEFWLGMQSTYDLRCAEIKAAAEPNRFLVVRIGTRSVTHSQQVSIERSHPSSTRSAPISKSRAVRSR